MDLLVCYIKQRWRIIAGGGAFCLIFIISFGLYHLPLEAVIYPFVLCVLLASILVIIDFKRVKRKHEVLESIHGITDAVTGMFPRIEGVEDNDYQKIIRLLCEEHNKYSTDTEQRYSDMTDYYTVWVHQIKTPIASMRLQLQNEDTSFSRKLSTDLFRF